MADIALILNNNGADIAIADNDIVLDNGLTTAVIISLFSDKRVSKQTINQQAQLQGEKASYTDNLYVGGYWADTLNSDYLTGSELWLLQRSKLDVATILQAEATAQESLQWLLDDGVTSDVIVNANSQQDYLTLDIKIDSPDFSKNGCPVNGEKSESVDTLS